MSVDDCNAFLLRVWYGKPVYLWIVWALAGLSYFFLLVGLMADQLGVVNIVIKVSGITETEKGICKWKTLYVYASSGSASASSTNTYTSFDITDYTLQYEAGQAFIAFGILATLLGAAFVYGSIKDYMAGEFDKEKIGDYLKSCDCGKFGFTRIGLIACSVCEFLMLVIYGARQKCSSEDFWIPSAVQSFVTSYTYAGGASLGLVSLSFIFIIFIFILTYYVLSYMSPESRKVATDKDNNNNNTTANNTTNNQTDASSPDSKKEVSSTQVSTPPSKSRPNVPPPAPAPTK